jgi:hypothetical protein
MENPYKYLLDRVRDAEFEPEPFPHLYLRDFLKEADFREVISSEDVNLTEASDLDELFTNLKSAGYEAIVFPGCTQIVAEYRKWLEGKSKLSQTHEACEGQGMALRLQSPKNDAVIALNAFFRSTELKDLLVSKFGLVAPTRVEAGLQKYLHGYEISPHPDIRLKALTWMLNVNPASNSESLDFHTHYLKFKPEYSFIPSLWENNPTVETCWVPWDWCTSVKRQPENNSIVIFSPRWDSIHAVRAHYDHLRTQRTQFYGNLWYEASEVNTRPEFTDFDFKSARYQRKEHPLLKNAKRALQLAKSRM